MAQKLFLELMESWDKFADVRETQVDESAIVRTIELSTNKAGYSARMWAAKMEEAITTSNFPYLFGQVLDRQVLAKYKAHTADWRKFCKVGSSKDFRTKYIEKIQGADQHLDEVGEKGEYLVSPVSDSRYSLAVKKKGKQFDISWEAVINDDLDAFGDIPRRYSMDAIRTEAREVCQLYSSVTGPNALLYGAPIADVDGANVTNLGALALNIANLEITIAAMMGQVDVYGEPVLVDAVTLVVPPALKFTAKAIVTSAARLATDDAGGAFTLTPALNVMAQEGLTVVVDPYLPVIDVSGNVATTWYVFCNPAEAPSLQYDYLKGHETPEICMKASDKVSMSGALLSPFSGDFQSDNVVYRVRVVTGGTQLDPRFTYAQVG